MIKLIKSSFYNEAETKKALSDFILNAEILSMNIQCKKFEEDFAKKQGRAYAVYVSNGSVANLLLLQSLLNDNRLKKGMRIGFSALTWPTNVMPILQLGLNPVPIDCNPETLNVSPSELSRQIDDIDCLFLTNVLGFCDDIEAIRTLCEEKRVLLLEDNCESMGSKVSATHLGNFGFASTFSFFVGHHMSTVEGGMVCTDDESLYDQLVMGRAHGWDRNLSPEKQQKMRGENGINNFYARYTFYDIASNFRPTEIQGFIGNTQLPYWDEIVNKRARNFARFNQVVAENPDIKPLSTDHMSLVSNFAMPVICVTPDFSEKYRQKFEGAGVETRPIIAGNMVRQPFYKKYVIEQPELPHSDYIHSNGFYFGNNPELTEEEISLLCSLLVKGA